MVDLPTTSSKEAILAAALNLLARRGYAGLSMRELATESGLAKATIYHYFQDKEDILANVIVQNMQEMRRRVLAAAAQESDYQAKVRAIVFTHFGAIQEQRAVILTILREISEPRPTLRALIQEQHKAYIDALAAILQAGADQGVFRKADPQLTALSLLGLVNVFVSSRLLFCDLEMDAAAAEHILDLFFHGIVYKTSENSHTVK